MKIRVHFERPEPMYVEIPDGIYDDGGDNSITNWLAENVTEVAYVEDWEEFDGGSESGRVQAG